MSDSGAYAGYLSQADYYSEDGTIPGQWRGRGAEMLGLRGPVRQADYDAVRQAHHPTTGEFLRQRHGADRRAADGRKQSRARDGFDIVLIAPKSVAIMAQRSLAWILF